MIQGLQKRQDPCADCSSHQKSKEQKKAAAFSNTNFFFFFLNDCLILLSPQSTEDLRLQKICRKKIRKTTGYKKHIKKTRES